MGCNLTSGSLGFELLPGHLPCGNQSTTFKLFSLQFFFCSSYAITARCPVAVSLRMVLHDLPGSFSFPGMKASLTRKGVPCPHTPSQHGEVRKFRNCYVASQVSHSDHRSGKIWSLQINGQTVENFCDSFFPNKISNKDKKRSWIQCVNSLFFHYKSMPNIFFSHEAQFISSSDATTDGT